MAGKKRKRSRSRGKKRRTTSKKRKVNFAKKVNQAIKLSQRGWGDLPQQIPGPLGRNDAVRRLRYRVIKKLNITSSLAAGRQYIAIRPDSCYDPEVAAGGTQPYGFDQYAALYQEYSVLGAKMNVKFWSTKGSATPVPVLCLVELSKIAVPATDIKANTYLQKSDVNRMILPGTP